MKSSSALVRVSSVAGVAVVVLSGCSAGTSGESAEPTRTVATSLGTVQVPLEVDSVVVVEGRRDLDVVLALELPLVGFPVDSDSASFDLEAPLGDALDEARAEGARELFNRNEVDLEAIAAADPDLIVGRDEDVERVYDQLSAIAPVIPLSSVASGGAWQDDLRLVAEATGRDDRAAELVAAYDARVQELSRQYTQQIAETVVLPLDWAPEGSGVVTSRLQTEVLTDLGAVFGSAVTAARDAGGTAEYGPEELVTAAGDADALLLIVDTPEEMTSLAADPLWPLLPAAGTDRVVRTDKFTHEGGPLTAMAVLDLAEQLYAAG